ncbi:MAG: GNAT family N-acetyltransferase [Candidatus Shapirobacteria bacterium]
MEIEIKAIEIKDKEILRKMIEIYEKEISGEDAGEYKYFDSYWEKKNRWPFFIMVDKKIAGFVLVNEYNLVELTAKDLSEFYIKKEYRHQRIGLKAANKVFDMFLGKWEIREIVENPKARQFWLKVIDEYTRGNFKEVTMDNDKWHGWIQTFDNSK